MLSVRNKLAALAATAVLSAVSSADEQFSIVVDPRTGAASLRNDSPATVQLDGYLLRATSPLLDPAGWISLESSGSPGWNESAAAGNRLGELNLLGSQSLAPGQLLSIGAPYAELTPTVIGAPEPVFDFTYSIAGVGSFTGDVEFSRRNTLVLEIDPATGQTEIVNQSPFAVELSGYLIRSTQSVLNTAGWSPLQGSTPGWQAAAGATNRLAEGNLLGSTFLAANGGSLPIGSPINAALLDDESDLSLEVRIESVGTIAGGVLFTSAGVVGLPGDYNADGFVNAADYTVWRDGNSPDSSRAGYNLWAGNYGSSIGGSASAAASAPEPSSLVCVALASASCFVVRKRG